MKPEDRQLVEGLAARFRGRCHWELTGPVLVFPKGLSESEFRGLQRALRGRVALVWGAQEILP